MQYQVETVPFTDFNKEGLTVYLSKYLKDYFEDSNRQYVLSYENKSVSNVVGCSNELQEHDHEEADTLIILRAVDTVKLNPFSECIVYSSDTDVFLLLIHHYSKLPQVLHFLQQFCFVKNYNLIFRIYIHLRLIIYYELLSS